MSKYGVFSGPYFSAFGWNTGEYGPEKTPYFVNYFVILESYKPLQVLDYFEIS